MDHTIRPLRSSSLCIVFAALCVSTAAFGAGPRALPPGFVPDPVARPDCIFEISDTIDSSTVSYVKEQYELKERYAALKKGQISSCLLGRPAVWLDSPGGDVESAMAIGRFFREKQIVVIVPSGARCASACVIALLGGVERRVVGRIGIHRPYEVNYSTSVQNSQAAYTKASSLVARYFKEMNIPFKLLDAMNAISPDEVRWLSFAEDRALDISGTDPAWEDFRDSQIAQSLGISKQSLYERRAMAKESCAQQQDFTQRMLCEQSIIHGKQ